MFATGLCFASIVSTVSSLFEGQSIAILPFEPVFFFKSLAQRGLTLAKPNDCSFFFLVSFCILHYFFMNHKNLFILCLVHFINNGTSTTTSKTSWICPKPICFKTVQYCLSTTSRHYPVLWPWQLLITDYTQLIAKSINFMKIYFRLMSL